MEIRATCLPDAPPKPARRRSKKATRPQLLTRSSLDGRTSAAKMFDKLVADIEADLGGRDQLSTIEVALVEAFAGAALTLHHLNARLALGQPIDLSQHAQCVGAMVRVASRLGLQRRQNDVTSMSLAEYLTSHASEESEAVAAGELDEAKRTAAEMKMQASGHGCGSAEPSGGGT